MELSNKINSFLETIAIVNSFIDDTKTYKISVIDKVNNDFTETLRTHFKVEKWTFEISEIKEGWKTRLKKDVTPYFGQYVLQTKEQFTENEAELILNNHNNVKRLLVLFINDLEQLVKNNSKFYTVEVHWVNPYDYEGWYETSHNDYLFDLGEQIVFLHFGTSD